MHLMHETSTDSLAEFHKVNVEGSLVRQTVAAGVKRLVFVSSIKVDGKGTVLGQSYIADATESPSVPYWVSAHGITWLI